MEQVTGSRGADPAVDEKKRKLEVEKKFLPFVLRLTKPWALAWSCDRPFAGRVFSRREEAPPAGFFYTDEGAAREKKTLRQKTPLLLALFLSVLDVFIYAYGVLISL